MTAPTWAANLRPLVVLAAVAAPAAAAALCADPAAVLSRMTFAERCGLLHGTGRVEPYVGNLAAVPRVGVPALALNDGPQGFRVDAYPGTTTQWPSAMTVAATWDEASVEAWASAMGREFVAKGANVFLGPGINVARVPEGGRNFEYMSGEDPVLGARLVGPFVRAMQAQGVIACAKHFVLNNQETSRLYVSADADDRTVREVYLPPFEAAVRAGVGSFMCSYNRINGTWACQNRHVLEGLLRRDLAFTGWVMSDWGATHSASLAKGLDQEMPGSAWFNCDNLKATPGLVDRAALRVLRVMARAGLLRPPGAPCANRTLPAVQDSSPGPPVSASEPRPVSVNTTSDENRHLACLLSARSMALLRNKGQLLPLKGIASAFSGRTAARLLIVGKEALRPTTAGGGSGGVSAAWVRPPLDAIRERLESDGESGYTVEFDDGADADRAAVAAAAADVTVALVGCSSAEGADRPSLRLGGGQDELLAALARAAGNRLAVVFASPGAVVTAPWAHAAGAVIAAFMPGEQYACALAKVLSGDIDPSGRLPITFPNVENEFGWDRAMFPGQGGHVSYREHADFGYRWYDAHGVAPAFPFGHGLSYAGTFAYGPLHVDGRAMTVSLGILNAGDREGTEVVQLYLRFPPGVRAPSIQLKAFKSVTVPPRKNIRVTLQLTVRDFSVWDEERRDWVVACGEIRLFAGASATDLRRTASMHFRSRHTGSCAHPHAAVAEYAATE